MVRTCFALLMVSAPAFAQGNEAQLRKTLDSLQGNWQVSKVTVAGKQAAGSPQQGYTFNGDTLTRGSKPEETVRLTFTKTGPVSTFEFNDRNGNVTVGIVQRTGDKVQMCLIENGTTPPKDFTSTGQNNAVLIEFSPSKR